MRGWKSLFAGAVALGVAGFGLVAPSGATADEVPIVSIADTGVVEGDFGPHRAVFAITLSEPVGTVVTMRASTSVGTATLDDFQAVAKTVKIPAGAVAATFAVPVISDGQSEFDETFSVTLSQIVGVEAGEATADGLIIDDDLEFGAGVFAHLGDASVVEGDAGARSLRFSVSLNEPNIESDVVMRISTDNGTADSADFSPRAGRVTIKAGETQGVFIVKVAPDTAAEDDEVLTATIRSVTGAVLGRAQGTGTILDDDTIECLDDGSPYTDEVVIGGVCSHPPIAYDADEDGYPAQQATDGSPDCDDTDPDRNPGMTEIVGNSIDDDCDNIVDESSGEE